MLITRGKPNPTQPNPRYYSNVIIHNGVIFSTIKINAAVKSFQSSSILFEKIIFIEPHRVQQISPF